MSIPIPVLGKHQNGRVKEQTGTNVEKTDENLEKPPNVMSITFTWDTLLRECRPSNSLVDEYRKDARNANLCKSI